MFAIRAAVAAVVLFSATAFAQQEETDATGIFHGVGTVVAIVPAQPAVTLKHEDIKGLMPAMEMMYRVQSQDLLNGLKVGERVEFDVQAKGYVIIAIRPAP